MNLNDLIGKNRSQIMLIKCIKLIANVKTNCKVLAVMIRVLLYKI